MEEYDCSLTDKNCMPYNFDKKKRTDPYLKDGKCVTHSLSVIEGNISDDEQKRQKVQSFFEEMGW